MGQNQQFDTASEPVDVTGDAEFMDTGVLYEDDDKASSGDRKTWPVCTDKACTLEHPHAPVKKESQ